MLPTVRRDVVLARVSAAKRGWEAAHLLRYAEERASSLGLTSLDGLGLSNPSVVTHRYHLVFMTLLCSIYTHDHVAYTPALQLDVANVSVELPQ